MSKQSRYIVTYTVDFTRARGVSASSVEDAIHKAETMERTHQETLRRSGYIIGDIDVIDASRDAEVSSEW